MPDDDDYECYDEYIVFEVLLPQYGDHMQYSKVISHSEGNMGNVIRVRNYNPIHDTRVYDVMFPDWSLTHYYANIIAENVY